MSLKMEYAHASGCSEPCCVQFMNLAQMYTARQEPGTLGLLNAAAVDVRKCSEAVRTAMGER